MTTAARRSQAAIPSIIEQLMKLRELEKKQKQAESITKTTPTPKTPPTASEQVSRSLKVNNTTTPVVNQQVVANQNVGNNLMTIKDQTLQGGRSIADSTVSHLRGGVEPVTNTLAQEGGKKIVEEGAKEGLKTGAAAFAKGANYVALGLHIASAMGLDPDEEGWQGIRSGGGSSFGYNPGSYVAQV